MSETTENPEKAPENAPPPAAESAPDEPPQPATPPDSVAADVGPSSGGEGAGASPVAARPFFTPQRFLFAAMTLFILFTRLYNLDLKPVQHDESMFALYSWQPYDALKKALAERSKQPDAAAQVQVKPVTLKDCWDRFRAAYNYDPLLHGPVLQWTTATMFLIFGDSTYTMRLLPALCGLGMMAVLLLLRDDIGRRRAYLAIAFLAISPTTTFFTRYIRPDNLMLFQYMLIVLTAWRYSKTLKARWLIALIFLMWAGSATHETYVIFYFFIATFAFGNWLHGVVKKKPADEIPFWREIRHAFLKQWWAVLIGNALGIFFSVMVMTSLFYGPFMHHWDGQWEAIVYWQGQNKIHRIEGEYHFYLIHLFLYELPFLLFFTVMIVKQLWAEKPGPSLWPRRWIFIGWAVGSWLILVMPMGTAKWTQGMGADIPYPLKETDKHALWNYPLPRNEKIRDTAGNITGYKGGDAKRVKFDFDQHFHMRRAGHIWLFLQILGVVLVTGWIHLNNGRVFHAWVDYWTCGSILAFGYAGEKVPWVTWHIVLPMMISCGLYADMVWRRRFDAPAEPSDTKLPAPKPEQADAKKKKKKGKNGDEKKEDAAPTGRPLVPAAVWKWGLGAAIVLALIWNFHIFFTLVYIQPGAAIERHTYASSHTEYRDATNFIAAEAHEKFQGEKTPIAWTAEGRWPEPGWPTVWVFRNWRNRISSINEGMVRLMVPMADPPGQPQEAIYALVQQQMFDLSPKPPFAERYVWKRVRFRHYWVPERHPLDWEAMKKIGLLLGPENGLSDQQKIDRNQGRKDWQRFWRAVVMRDEPFNRDVMGGGSVDGWHDLGGADIYVGRLKDKYLPQEAAAAPAS